MLVPGIGELIGGSQREERLDVLLARLDELGLARFLTANYDEVWVVDLRSLPTGMTALMEETAFDDILILYNFENLAADTNFYRINR